MSSLFSYRVVKMKKLLVLLILIAALAVAGCAENETSSNGADDGYQDDEWLQKADLWLYTMTLSAERLDESLSSLDFSKIEEDAAQLESTCSNALESSEQYNVSPSLQDAKSEYEAGIKDNIIAAKALQSAAKHIDSGDTDAAAASLDVASLYFDSGSRHVSAASVNMS
jgi:predicted small secreted protein